MRWPNAFVDLVLHFANRVAEVGDVPMSEALLLWTPLYLNFGLSRAFDPNDPTWQRYLTGYRVAEDPVGWTHSFYLMHARRHPESAYGCFSYHYETDSHCIRFHFGNRDASSVGPLSEERRQARLQELRDLFDDVRHDVPEAESVRGRSWMYNLESYCRLFPPEYVCSVEQAEAEVQFMSIWGQFLDHTWNLRSDRAGTFRQAIAAAHTLEELRHSFPMSVLAPRCSIDHFYAFYAVD